MVDEVKTEVKPEVKARKRRSDKVLVMPETVTAENCPTFQCMLRLNYKSLFRHRN